MEPRVRLEVALETSAIALGASKLLKLSSFREELPGVEGWVRGLGLEEGILRFLLLPSESEWWSTWTTWRLLDMMRLESGGARPRPMFLSW